jgi:hypothetical protein
MTVLNSASLEGTEQGRRGCDYRSGAAGMQGLH